MRTKLFGNAVLLTALLAASDGWTSVATGVDATCETSDTPTTFTGSTLDSATPTRSGVVYDGTGASLKLQKTAGLFTGSLLGVSNKILSGCAADFDGDGWVDFVGTGTGADGKLTFFKNQTYDNPEPTDWYDPTKIRTPKFVPGPAIYTDTTIGTVVTGCADLNGDGKTDVVLAAATAAHRLHAAEQRARSSSATATAPSRRRTLRALTRPASVSLGLVDELDRLHRLQRRRQARHGLGHPRGRPAPPAARSSSR